ncbi:MAG: dTMP kinase, partial [Candidatus Glassbacteria bacterium]
TREPGGTALGEDIRKILLQPVHTSIDPLTELLLYIACRAQLVKEVIRPALIEDKVVLIDRFSDSTIAYQGWGRGLDVQMIKEMNGFATGNIIPDITFVFDIEPEAGLARVSRRGKDGSVDRMEAEQISFHERVRKGFLELAKQENRCHVIDASKPIDHIQNELRMIYSNLVEKRAGM